MYTLNVQKGPMMKIYSYNVHAISTIQSRGLHIKSHILPGEDVVLDENLTCMHCRFFQEHLLHAYTTVTTQPTTEFTGPLFMVHKSLQHMNDPVQLVSNVIQSGTTRFSAKGKESLAIVHITFYQGNAQILCTDGHCAINFKNRKNITWRDPDQASTLSAVTCALCLSTGML